MIKNIIYLARIFYITTKRFFFEKYTFQVSALAFTTLLALVPLLSISVFFIAIFPVFSKFVFIYKDYILKNFVPSASYAIEGYFQDFIQQAIHLPIGSVIFLLFTALLMINTIDETINDIWHLPEKNKKILVWIFYAVIVIIAPILIGLSIFITSYIFSFYLFSKLTYFLLLALPIIINTILFSLFYIFSPDTYVRKIEGILGGFIAALLVEIARMLFGIYISLFSNYRLIYGIFSILPIFLMWLYICWFIILWGAVFTHTLSHSRKLNHKRYPCL